MSRLGSSLTALVLVLAAVVPSFVIASPLDDIAAVQHRREVQPETSLNPRANPLPIIQAGQSCTNPSQISLVGDPGYNHGSCGWKMWVACTSFAVGVCVIPCSTGGLADPACDGCLVGLGALGCKRCIQDNTVSDSGNVPGEDQLFNSLMTVTVGAQPKIVASLQKTYCDVAKPDAPIARYKQPATPANAATAPDASSKPASAATA